MFYDILFISLHIAFLTSAASIRCQHLAAMQGLPQRLIGNVWPHLLTHIDGLAQESRNSSELVQERRNSSPLALELRLSCTNPSICCLEFWTITNSYPDSK